MSAPFACQWSDAISTSAEERDKLCSHGWDAFAVFAAGASGPRAFATMG